LIFFEEDSVTHPKWTAWAGISAVAGGGLAILLTVPFAAAYFRAYSGFDPTPIWLAAFQPIVRPLLSFSQPVSVYNVYGRIYDLVYILFFPAALALHHLHRPLDSRFEKWAFWLTIVGLLASSVGVAGDYWADGAGFVLEFVGLFILATGATLSGIAFLRSRILPPWASWLLVLCLPGYFMWFFLIGHIPSGPTFGIALAYIGLGCVLLLRKYTTPHVQNQRAA
jgi:hypothetical protein